mgnify:FL=1
MTTASGIYVLTLRLPRRTTVTLRRRSVDLAAGWYLYVGSAMGGLRARVARHARTKEFRHWHIDALLAAGQIRDVQCCITANPDAECQLAGALAGRTDTTPVPGFGASDCKCPSHLTYSRQRPTVSIRSNRVRPHLTEIMTELHARYVDHASRARDPFRTLISCVLSLRTKDPVTHSASERLFDAIPTAEELSTADSSLVAELIYPVGMYREKARRLPQIAGQILMRFGGRTPSEIDDLLTLPGVGRKTANLVRSFAFHLPAICVDIHVHRITNRLGLVRTSCPDDTERELERLLPQEHWIGINPLLVQHGQQICRPTRPRCPSCPLVNRCTYPALCEETEILRDVPGIPPHPSLNVLPCAPAPKSPEVTHMDSPWDDT